MTNSIAKSFSKHYQAEVILQFQQMGSRLRNTVRSQNNVRGASTTFQKIGVAQATTKGRDSQISPMNVSHESVECMLEDYYAGDWVDKLDQLKQNHDELQALAKTGAYALGRKTDELIIKALSKVAPLNTGATTTGMTLDKALECFEEAGNSNIPDDGQSFVIVGWRQWAELLQIPQFASTDYISDDQLPFSGIQAKRWLGALWMPNSDLPLKGNVRTCYWYHKHAVGHAIGQEITTDITWHGDRASHFVNSMMSQGAVAIEQNGIIAFDCKEA